MNESAREVAYKETTITFNRKTDEIYKIHVGGQMIESTFNHPFYVKNKGWTFVKDLTVGDLLVQSNGNTLKIDSIEFLHKHVTVYNLTVDEFHTYFISDLGIWVHNTDVCVFSAKGNGELRATRRPAFDEWMKEGVEVNGQHFNLNKHAYNSLFKSGRKDIMPDDVTYALSQKSTPGNPGSVVYTNPVTGTKVYVNPTSSEIGGVQPRSFKD
ncbi:polymorphic toxin-type HINT domain-containing protein [Paenibacillus wenxiniae]|uniref:Polymorphic toxin-type HINT domain-containing protein n=1 Tax=Paenibacillus wenxiniae TaxID=1636843 RepID=A0ABW4RMS1_9BACL